MLVITWQIFDQYSMNTTQISHLRGHQVPKTVILSTRHKIMIFYMFFITLSFNHITNSLLLIEKALDSRKKQKL